MPVRLGISSVVLAYLFLLTIAVAQESPPAGADAEGFRMWTDISGKYTTEAALLHFSRGEVELRKRDGSTTRVPIGKLSRDDQRYVRAEVARRKPAAEPPVRARKKAPAAVPVDAWPGWRGAHRDGKSPDTGLLKEWPEGGPPLLWQTTGIGRGYSSVSVVDGTIYTTGVIDAQEVISAFDLDGQRKWQVPHGPAHDRDYPGSRSTPTISDGLLYVLSGSGKVGCYDARTGQGRWSRELTEFGGQVPGWAYAESVLIHKELAVVTPGGERCIVALDRRSGRPVWASTGFSAGAQYGSCISVEHRGAEMIVAGTAAGLVAVDADSGRMLWGNPFSADNTANCPTPAFADGYVFWANGYGQGGICMQLDVRGKQVTATPAWTTRDMVCHHGGYIIHEGFIYGNHNESWVCLDLRTGQQRWRERGVGKGSVCYADGMLYLFAEDGGQAALATCSPEGLELRGRMSVEGEENSWAHPVVIGGRLYLRYADNLYCFNVRATDD
jgi:outer membrane protein assembly factor BamB